MQDEPWEEGAGGHPAVIYDDKLKQFRIYYAGFSRSSYFSEQGPSYYPALPAGDPQLLDEETEFPARADSVRSGLDRTFRGEL